MKPTVGAIVVVGALLTFGTLGALLVGSCAREETKMEGMSREEVVAKARAELRSRLEKLQGQVENTGCACVIAIMEDEQGEVTSSVTFLGDMKRPIRFGGTLATCFDEVKQALRAVGGCNCPDCRAARAKTTLREAVGAFGPISAPGSSRDN